jgi:hypothetical protein
VAAHSRAAHSTTSESTPLNLEWPANVYSLSHVAIPFAPDDPIYGDGSVASETYRGLRLGALQPRGETSVLAVSMSQAMRLRHNPFFSYEEERIRGLIDDVVEMKNVPGSARLSSSVGASADAHADTTVVH